MIRQIEMVLISLIFLIGCTGAMPELGVESGELKKCPATPNCVNSQAKEKQHSIEPIIISGTIIDTKTKILKILNELKNCEIKAIKDDYIRAEFSSNIFRFVDDAEFFFQDMKSNEIVIHVRSAARVGYSDFGVNRKRIEQIRKKIEQ